MHDTVTVSVVFVILSHRLWPWHVWHCHRNESDFSKWFNQCQTNQMIDLTCWSTNCPGVLVHIMVCSACESPSNRKCCNVSYTNYTGENHSVNQIFLCWKCQEMSTYLANLVSFLANSWPLFSLLHHYFSFVTYSFQHRYDIAVLAHA